MRAKTIGLLSLIIVVSILNIVVFSPGLVGLKIGEDALSSAVGATLPLASVLALIYGIYTLIFKSPVEMPIKQIRTHDDYVQALSVYRRLKALGDDVALGLEQLERMRKKQAALTDVLMQRFRPDEISYGKFDSAIREVASLFYLNVRNVLNRLRLFDESDLARVSGPKTFRLSEEIVREKTELANGYVIFVKQAIGTNEEILLKLDRLLLEISRLDEFDPGDIENMSCMQEIDSLIKHTKLYRSEG
ncbi:hypothetical protein [Cohnella terricola]|uniref:Uncharacterized protein n=1 Tax=Cohnella terricola TaxID=1289167 RepID=A0A559JQ39_9BACL|nr:hypothetical protein [Cohnella terricola]TVY02005.1 hypothetical protein FPZ45_06055 [Cohnella terricola]